jgi:monodictyphenone polyketide synthase
VAGDDEEMQGIQNVYAPLNGGRGKSQPLHIGAVKSNVGHSESGAGTTALLKVLMMLQKNSIPPHVGIKTEMNPKFGHDWDKRNLHVAFENTPWPRPEGQKRLVAINNFGAAGGNTTMILEDAPCREIVETDNRPTHIVAVSAKTKASLTGNLNNMIGYLEANPAVALGDLSYTTTARRYHHQYRLAVGTSNIEHLKKQLTTCLDAVETLKPTGKSDPPQIAFTFTGQGASYKSMSLELYSEAPEFRRHMQHLDSLAQGQGFASFIPAIDGSHPKDHQHSPVVTQLAQVCTQMALTKYWASMGIVPDVVVGHSLGEYAAMQAAGVITPNEVIFMVGRRAQMLHERCEIGSHAMMAVRAPLHQIEEASQNKPYTIACVNGPQDTVLSGTTQQMDDVAVPLEAAGYRCIKLDVAFAFHSEQTDPILDDFESVAKSGVTFQEPKVPVISPLLGNVIFDGKTLSANYVRRATREPVNFLAAMEEANDAAAISDETIFIEIGPHPVCNGFVKSCMPTAAFAIPSLRRGDNAWKTMAESLGQLHLAGLDVNWNEFHRPFESRLRLLDLPTYAWNNKNYWLQYEGDWCLTKGNTFYTKDKDAAQNNSSVTPATEIQTSTAQQIVHSAFDGSAGSVTVQSDLQQPDFLAAAHGHNMNGCGVVTSVSSFSKCVVASLLTA